MYDVIAIVTDKMACKNTLFVLAYSALANAKGFCDFTSDRPYVTVANSTHLRINWTGSFNEVCDDGQIKSAQIKKRRGDYINNPEIEYKAFNYTTFDDKTIEVEADPCLKHDRIRVELEYPSYRGGNSYRD